MAPSFSSSQRRIINWCLNFIFKTSVASLRTGLFTFSLFLLSETFHTCEHYGLGYSVTLYPTGVHCYGSVSQQQGRWHYVTGFYVSVHKLQLCTAFLPPGLFLSRSLKSFLLSASQQTATLVELSCSCKSVGWLNVIKTQIWEQISISFFFFFNICAALSCECTIMNSHIAICFGMQWLSFSIKLILLPLQPVLTITVIHWLSYNCHSNCMRLHLPLFI